MTDVREAVGRTYSTYEAGNTANAAKADKADKADYGKTIGSPQLSDEAKEYYEHLKKKFGNMDFVLVSKDMKEMAKAQAGSYANPMKTVVLIDEEKIERMAADEDYRKQYEQIISNASSGMAQLKTSIQSLGAKVKGFGMQVNDGGLVSFFAVLKKSSAAQKERIEKASEKKKAEKKEAEAKAEKKAKEEALQSKQTDGKTDIVDIGDAADSVVITANSIEELLQRIQDYTFAEQSDLVQTKEEQMIGQNIDFKG